MDFRTSTKLLVFLLSTAVLFSVGCATKVWQESALSDKVYSARIESELKGLYGYSCWIDAFRRIKKGGKEVYFLKIHLSIPETINLTRITFRNPETGWEKTLSWDLIDVERRFGTTPMSFEEVSLIEEVVVVLSKENFLDLLSQGALDVRVYGDHFYVDSSFSPKTLVYWKEFLMNRMGREE